jgi:hypothetical protein
MIDEWIDRWIDGWMGNANKLLGILQIMIRQFFRVFLLGEVCESSVRVSRGFSTNSLPNIIKSS